MEWILKVVASVLLAAIFTGVGWIFTHVRKIRRTLEKDEALPKPGPTLNILVLLTAVLCGLSALLAAFILH